ncbi:MAG: PIN domain-containing protein [Candidatus Altiarchaeia archaeon]
MKLIVDSNVIVSALITKGVAFEVFKANSMLLKYDFYAPDYMLFEIMNHRGEMLSDAQISEKSFTNALDFLINEISIIPKEEFEEHMPKALERLSSHEKDAPYLALSLKLDCLIFSGDKKFQRLCPEKVKTPRQLLDDLLPKKV